MLEYMQMLLSCNAGKGTMKRYKDMEKKKVSAAQKRATAKYEKNNYFKTMIRFPIEKESEIRKAAKTSLNGFIVSAVLEKLEREKEKG